MELSAGRLLQRDTTVCIVRGIQPAMVRRGWNTGYDRYEGFL